MAGLNKKRIFKLLGLFLIRGREILADPDRLKETIAEVQNFISGKQGGPLREIIDRLKLLLAMLNDYRKGVYKKLPKRTLISALALFLYITSPIDVIPDFIPVIGFMDDLFLFNFLWDQISKDVSDYSAWRQNQLKALEITPQGNEQESKNYV